MFKPYGRGRPRDQLYGGPCLADLIEEEKAKEESKVKSEVKRYDRAPHPILDEL
jgi:hypothetical protein